VPSSARFTAATRRPEKSISAGIPGVRPQADSRAFSVTAMRPRTRAYCPAATGGFGTSTYRRRVSRRTTSSAESVSPGRTAHTSE
jgi:hypothetical protein